MSDVEIAIERVEHRLSHFEDMYRNCKDKQDKDAWGENVRIYSTILANLRDKQKRIDIGVDWLTPTLTELLLSALPICKGCDGKIDGVRTDKCEGDADIPEKCIHRAAALVAELAEWEKGCDHCNGSPKSSPLYHWLNAGYKNCPYCGKKLPGGAE